MSVADQVGVTDRMRLAEMVFGAMVTQAVGTAARLGVADLLGDEERTAEEVAGATHTPVEPMTRLLRALAAFGLVTETRPGGFRLAGPGYLLRTDRPDSMHTSVLTFTDPSMLDAWRELDTAVRTGRTMFDKVFGTDFFSYLAERPQLSKRFNTAMRQNTLPAARALPTTFDFARFETVVDVGGGDGTLLAEVLRAFPTLRGVVYDTAEGLAQAPATLAAAGVADRCRTEAGDFFASVPSGAEVYLMKSVIHDWDDDRCATILGHCRRALPEHGRVLIVEPVLPDVVNGAVPPLMYLSDLNMLVNVGGRERTLAEFEALCARASLRLTAVHPLPPPLAFAVLEAAPA